jgi:3-hydroxyisobutyrate dehydrogenase-like beta-hydroxyacid dehydrogenase
MTTIAILYPGEMGAALGRLLCASGQHVVTTLAGRSPRTAQQAAAAGLEVLPSLRDVARCASWVFALVPPAAAVAVAAAYAASKPDTDFTPIYVDLNSIAPQTVAAIQQVLAPHGVEMVDGAIHGLASQLATRGTVYLSGPAAPAVAEVLGRVVRVRLLGPIIGRASTFRLLLSSLTKGINALFLETAVAASQAGLLAELLAGTAQTYPGIWDIIERLLPTYPRYACRRAQEVQELEQMLLGLGMRPVLAPAVRQLLEELAALGLAPEESSSLTAVIEEAARRGLEQHPLPASPETRARSRANRVKGEG